MFATACMCSNADQAVSVQQCSTPLVVLDDLPVILVEKQHLVVLNSLPIIGKIVVLDGLLVIGLRSHYLQDFLLKSGVN